MARHKTNFEESAWMNNGTYMQYFNRLTELSISMFEWENVPEEIDVRFLELTLFQDGKAVFFKDSDMDEYLALKCAVNGGFNVYGIPVNRRAYSPTNGYQKQLTEDDSVIIWNNMLHKNSILEIKNFAKRLYNLDRIIDVNANAQKTPVLVLAQPEQRLTMVNLFKEMDGNAPVIFGDKNLDIQNIRAVSTEAPYIADKIYQLKTQIWNEALTYLGISNTNITKKERMVTDEVVRNMGGVIASRYSRLDSRRKAAEEINKMFGLNIEVNYKEDYREADDEIMMDGATGGDDLKPFVNDLRTNAGVLKA